MKNLKDISLRTFPYPLFNLISLILAILLIMRFSFTVSPINLVLIVLISFIVFTMISLIARKNRKIEFAKFGVVILLGILLRLAAIQMETGNDVFWVSQGAVESLLMGTNPYAATFFVPNNPAWEGIPITLTTYFPGTILFETPFYLIFNDVRYAVLFADVGIAILLYFIIRMKNEDYARAATSFYMLVTSLTFVFPNIIFDYRITDGLTDPIMTFLLLFSILAWIKDKRILAALIFGMAIATRQFSILFFIPMVVFWMKKDYENRRDYKSLAISVIFATLIIFPFFIMSPAEFIDDTFIGIGAKSISASLGLPQWNMSIPGQITFFEIEVDRITSSILQLCFIAGIMIFLRNRINDMPNVVLAFTILYVVFLAFGNFTQYFYWFNVIPFLLLIFVWQVTKKKIIE